ncbi:M56 family metallopeptidase [Fulvivirga lutea]|uniref:TonB family protein n=1 Tax=Fulvivirga lutea TaxID=2810512 RepID=A0A974WDV1_9BACT|nr:M56 family metallopeptidase [Fulvivirga lutea]QSE96358.1 TonB family protein [Fulvivirga lutea]
MMNNLINYFIEANICLLIFGILYFLFFKNETDFKFRRNYLLVATMSTLIVPLFKFGALNEQYTFVQTIQTTVLPEIVIGSEVSSDSSYAGTWITYLKYGYLIVSVILLQIFAFQLAQVCWFYFSTSTDKTKKDGFTLVYTNGTLPTFTFFKILFFDNSVSLNSNEKNRITAHELVHIKQNHSLDIILIELAKIVLWINPISWLFRNEIQDVHEYLADDAVTSEEDTDKYKQLLAKMALAQAHLSIGHHFSKSKTLKRIEMINTIKQKVNKWKAVAIMPLIVIMAVVISCNDEIYKDVDNVMQTASQTEVPLSLQPTFNELKQKYTGAELAYIETPGTTHHSLSNLKDLDPNSIVHIEVFKKEEKIGVIFNKNGTFETLEAQLQEGDIYTIVDQPAMPEGGFDAYYKEIAQALRYPEEAKKAGIQGKVYVQFVVNETGSVEEVQVVKGIGEACDMAAANAVKVAGKWSAPMKDGKAVKQRIILPITFKLDDVDETKSPNKKDKFVEIEEV